MAKRIRTKRVRNQRGNTEQASPVEATSAPTAVVDPPAEVESSPEPTPEVEPEVESTSTSTSHDKIINWRRGTDQEAKFTTIVNPDGTIHSRIYLRDNPKAAWGRAVVDGGGDTIDECQANVKGKLPKTDAIHSSMRALTTRNMRLSWQEATGTRPTQTGSAASNSSRGRNAVNRLEEAATLREQVLHMADGLDAFRLGLLAIRDKLDAVLASAPNEGNGDSNESSEIEGNGDSK